jgi:hypothetical protein
VPQVSIKASKYFLYLSPSKVPVMPLHVTSTMSEVTRHANTILISQDTTSVFLIGSLCFIKVKHKVKILNHKAK